MKAYKTLWSFQRHRFEDICDYVSKSSRNNEQNI